MNDSILLVSNSDDLHMDLVEEHLSSLQEKYFRINLNQFPRDYTISIAKNIESNTFKITHIPSGKQIDSHALKSTWLRKSAPFCFKSDDLIPQEKAFANEQCEHLLHGFLNSLNCYYISHPKKLRAAQWKIEQLSRAKKLGFRVPDSLITNEPTQIEKFYIKHQHKIITKALSDVYLGADKVQMEEVVNTGQGTSLISEEDAQHFDAVEEIPCFFQEYIEKSFELRVTIVGKTVFTAKIDSQSDERTKIDFRDFTADIKYSAFTLPPDIEEQCVNLLKSYGLEYGAIDLIYTPDQEFVFLENNPGGQFWFIQELVPDLKIMEQVATCLIRGHG